MSLRLDPLLLLYPLKATGCVGGGLVAGKASGMGGGSLRFTEDGGLGQPHGTLSGPQGGVPGT